LPSHSILNRGNSASRRSERGEGKFKAVVITAIILLIIYCAVKIVPAYVSDYQLSDKMQEQARYAVVNRYNEDQIRDNIYKVTQDLDLPVKREEIKVLSTNSVVKISVDLHFAPSSENKSIL